MLNITENQLDEWVRGNSRNAQGLIVELVWRLVAASCPRPNERRFPLGDSIGQHGPDGFLDVGLGFDPFVPEGLSFWEIGTALRASEKATSDYKDLVCQVPENARLKSTFIFVTPLSGRRDWEYTWKKDAQRKWLDDRRALREWHDVRVIDGTILIDWISQFPPVGLWLAQATTGTSIQHIETIESYWNLIRTFGQPPLLTPNLFLANREKACDKLKDVVSGTVVQLKLETHFPNHVVDFVSAYIADLDAESRVDVHGRWIIVSNADAWNAIASQKNNLTLIADPTLDLSGELGTKLIQRARTAGHSVIFGGPAAGIPDPASVPLGSPNSHQVREALEHAGYSRERARTLAQRSNADLGSLLRCLQNLSLMPEWAEGTVVSDLVIAELLGSWQESSAADRLIVEGLSGNPYGEWVEKMREVMLNRATPLTHQDGNWRFAARYEGWYVLGPKVFDDHLHRLETATTTVLMERDPQFDLPAEERYAAAIYGKVFEHSNLLRSGLAESLALVGSHPKALTSCTLGTAEAIATSSVRKILRDADWERWAGLTDVLPLLAEASPEKFLEAVEDALVPEHCPFDQIFLEEGDGTTGRTYMSGILWALETLAWDPDHLTRVVICLGALAVRDPGGTWANRPANSLATILLPWLPRTCATVQKRGAAVSALLAEFPDVGWKLLLSLLPRSHSTSFGTRRPSWRDIIPDDWPDEITQGEYWDQIECYSEMAIDAVRNDNTRLVELVEQIENLPEKAFKKVLAYLESDDVVNMQQSHRHRLWTSLVDLITKHRKFRDAEWAMEESKVNQIDSVAERLSFDEPSLRHQRLFGDNDFDLYEKKGSYEDQRSALEIRRQVAVTEVVDSGGVQAVLKFSAMVQSPWRVGIAFGSVAPMDADDAVLPRLLDSEPRSSTQFTAGFVMGRFQVHGWQWVDELDTAQWTSEQMGQLLAFLPFEPRTWKRSSSLLGSNESSYWTKVNAYPYEAGEDLELAVDALIKYERPNAALRCLHKVLTCSERFNVEQAIRALLAAVESSEGTHSVDVHQTTEIIQAVQSNPATNEKELFRVEWAYLPLLGRHSRGSPTLLNQSLATEPTFFCEVVRLVFFSEKDNGAADPPTEEERAIVSNAYNLLSDWRFPPGCHTDGSYDGDHLNTWLDAVKSECTKTGHLEIAMIMVGHSLVYAPADPDGLWIHRSVAKVLNSVGAKDMREGFRTELFNSRGVHWVDRTGTQETELARMYRDKADAVDNAGYHRLASTLRQLADTYVHEAERVARAG